MKHFTSITLIIFTLISPLSSYALPKTQKLGKAAAVVEKYCKADAEGARLSSQTHSKIKDLVTWEDEPGWDTAVIIKSFKISKEVCTTQKAEVTVIYDVVQRQTAEGSWKKVHEKEQVVFHLVNVNGDWKIESPQEAPHIFTLPK